MTGEGDLFDLVAVKLLLEEALGCKVDVVSAGASRHAGAIPCCEMSAPPRDEAAKVPDILEECERIVK